MQGPQIIQQDLQCPSCAGQCAFVPETGQLTCTSCGTGQDLSTDRDHTARDESRYDPNADELQMLWTTTHHCQTCGGDVIFTGAAISERCAYCDGPVVMAGQDVGYATMALVPFSVEQAEGERRAADWISTRWAAPNDLADAMAKGRIAGIYAPFWTFDSEEAVDYWASYKVKRGKKTYTRQTSGHMNITFDDLLVPASHHVTPLIRDGILHDFDPRSLRPFGPGYLAGFAAERHHQTVNEGLEANRRDKDLLIRNRIRQRISKRGVHNIRYKTDTTGIRYRRILLPVWIVHYTYNDTPMKVVVCGLHGRTFGERPFSTLKLAGFSAILSAAAIGFGLFWGGAGML